MAKKKKKIPILEKREEIRKILRKYEKEETQQVQAPSEEFSLESREFKQFQKDIAESQESTKFFERACRFSGKVLKIGMKQKEREKLDSMLYFIGYNIKAEEVISLSILAFLVFLVIGGVLLFTLGFTFALFAIMFGLILLVGVQQYPKYLAKIENMNAMNNMPLAITYMVIYLRTTPTLEGAVGFAAGHLGGSVARDLRRLMWNLENGIYLNMDQALKEYAGEWQDSHKSFSEAIEVIRNSQKLATQEERLQMLDEASRVILQGNLETMEGFARSLHMPILVLYMMGIVLPVMGLVLTPILTSLMAQEMSANFLVLVYNIILPILIYFMIKFVLAKRPGAFSHPDIRDYPGIAREHHFLLGEHQVPLLPISLILFFLISIPGFTWLLGPQEVGYSLANILKSMTFIWGASIAIFVYTWGNAHQKLKIRKEVEDLEDGLGVALYELGNKLAMGTPIETAMEDTAKSLEKGAIRGLFAKTSENMRKFSMPLKAALFDPTEGALLYYPSKLARTLMEVLVESCGKGLNAASVSLTTMSRYLENLKSVKGKIADLIGETISAMKFQAQFLTSFIGGVILALDILLFRILVELGAELEALSMPTDMAGVTGGSISGVFKNSMFNVAYVVPAEHLQLIVGVYMMQVTLLLSILINGVMNGKDDIYRDYTIGTNLLMSMMIYTIAIIMGIVIFSSFKFGI